MKDVEFGALVGETVTKVTGMVKDSDKVTLETESGRVFTMLHEQDCCEYVRVEDVTGNPDDLVGSPILKAEESSNAQEGASESGTWTFYNFATIKGYVTLRWLGESNGYYSESVSLTCRPRKAAA